MSTSIVRKKWGTGPIDVTSRRAMVATIAAAASGPPPKVVPSAPRPK